jgi:hypothetical protein
MQPAWYICIDNHYDQKQLASVVAEFSLANGVGSAAGHRADSGAVACSSSGNRIHDTPDGSRSYALQEHRE